MKFPSFFPKSSVGIDIGTSEIKVVQLSSFAGKIKLENYAQISSKSLYQKSFKTLGKDTIFLSTDLIIKAIRAIFEEANIKTESACFSIPDFVSFFTTFELPSLTKEEIPFAVESEARKLIPLPISEVVWDWQLLGKRSVGGKEKLKILLVSVPKETVNQYTSVAKSLGIKFTLEAEIFALIRALSEKGKTVAIIDIGARSTSCTITEDKVFKLSRSFDFSEEGLSQVISKSLGIERDLAESLKKKYGLLPTQHFQARAIREILIPPINSFLLEIEQTFSRFKSLEKKEVEKIILTGGEATLPGLLQYFQNYFKKEVEIANPFKNLEFPPILAQVLKEKGPVFSIAVGLALRGLE